MKRILAFSTLFFLSLNSLAWATVWDEYLVAVSSAKEKEDCIEALRAELGALETKIRAAEKRGVTGGWQLLLDDIRANGGDIPQEKFKSPILWLYSNMARLGLTSRDLEERPGVSALVLERVRAALVGETPLDHLALLKRRLGPVFFEIDQERAEEKAHSATVPRPGRRPGRVASSAEIRNWLLREMLVRGWDFATLQRQTFGDDTDFKVSVQRLLAGDAIEYPDRARIRLELEDKLDRPDNLIPDGVAGSSTREEWVDLINAHLEILGRDLDDLADDMHPDRFGRLKRFMEGELGLGDTDTDENMGLRSLQDVIEFLERLEEERSS